MYVYLTVAIMIHHKVFCQIAQFALCKQFEIVIFVVLAIISVGTIEFNFAPEHSSGSIQCARIDLKLFGCVCFFIRRKKELVRSNEEFCHGILTEFIYEISNIK